PQLVQIGLTYVFMDDTSKRWAAGIAGASLFVDVFFDIWYKIGGAGVPNYAIIPVALMESLFIYTLGSELMLTVSFGMVIKLWPDFAREISYIIIPIWRKIKAGGMWFAGSNEPEDRSQNYKKNDNRKQIRPNTRSELNPRWQESKPAYNTSENMATEWDLDKEDDVQEMESILENHHELPIKARGRPKGSRNKSRDNEE